MQSAGNNPNIPQEFLAHMFARQKQLQKELWGIDYPTLAPEEVPACIAALVAELGEVLHADSAWKGWKAEARVGTRQDIGDELADVWAFVINLTMMYNFDFYDIYSAYLQKNDAVRKRHNLPEFK